MQVGSKPNADVGVDVNYRAAQRSSQLELRAVPGPGRVSRTTVRCLDLRIGCCTLELGILAGKVRHWRQKTWYWLFC